MPNNKQEKKSECCDLCYWKDKHGEGCKRYTCPCHSKEETVEEHHSKGHQFDRDIENCKIKPFVSKDD